MSKRTEKAAGSGLITSVPDPSSLITSVKQPIVTAHKKEPSGFSLFSCCFGKQDDTSHHEMAQVSNSHNHHQSSSVGSNKSSFYNTSVVSSDKKFLLPDLLPEDVGKKCLVLDLDETLVHSSFKPVPNSDFIIPIEIDHQFHNVHVLKRPGVDLFLEKLGSQFEIVVFTASLGKYADPVMDMLDIHKVVKHRLFREACIHHKGNYVKDLGQLGREIKDTIIIDNSPASYVFHPANAIPISSWFNDLHDTELFELIPFLEDLKSVDDVTVVLDNSNA